MDKRTMVKEAIAHRGPGHVPQCIILAPDAREAYGRRLLEDYAEADIVKALDEGLIDFDLAWSLAIGNHVVYTGRPPWWDWYNIPESFWLEDNPGILPDTCGTGSYDAYVRRIQYLRNNHDVYILAEIFGSHIEKARNCRGLANIMADLVADPAWTQGLLDTIIRKNIVMLENIAAFPELDGILLGSDWGSQKDLFMSPETWRTMIKGGEQQEYDLIHRYGKDVFVHSCGKIDRIIPDLCEMGLDVLNPVQPECMDIYKLKDTWGGKLTFYGGISTQRVLPYGSPAEVAEETRKVTEYLSRDGGYIISPSQEIQADVPYENLRALIDTAREFA